MLTYWGVTLKPFYVFLPNPSMIITLFTDGYMPDAPLQFIGVRTHTGEHRFFSTPEEFADYFLGTDDKIVIGFNILKFDLPYLLLLLKGSPRFPDLFQKINYANIVDLFPILTFRNKGTIKGLSHYLAERDIPLPPTDKDIARTKSQNDARKKLDALNDLYWKLREEQ